MFLFSGALGAGLYGNEEAHAGVQDFVDAVVATNRTVENAFEVVSCFHFFLEYLIAKCILKVFFNLYHVCCIFEQSRGVAIKNLLQVQ